MLEETQDREEIIERVAALDIGKAELVACVRVPSPQGLSLDPPLILWVAG
jgi:transposase